MTKPTGIPELFQAIEPLAGEKGYVLLDVVFGTAFRRRTLTVYIDKEQGVQVEDCQALAREIGQLLDEQDLVKGSYVLEISSPGAERKLKSEREFLHFVGRYALVRTNGLIAEIGKDEVYGYLRGLEDGYLLLETESGIELRIAMDSINKARLAIKF